MNLGDEGTRDRLLTCGPLGSWRTLPGTHIQLVDESIDFREDGTGEMRRDTGLYWVLKGSSTPGFWECTLPLVPIPPSELDRTS